jgi:hypothetical protein
MDDSFLTSHLGRGPPLVGGGGFLEWAKEYYSSTTSL